MAEASVASSLHALAVRDIRDGLHHEGRRGWEFIELASLGNNRVRSYLIALLRILLYPVGLGVVVGLVVGVQNALAHRPFSGVGPVGGVILQFGTIIMIGIAVLRTVMRTHRRPWLSLIAPDLRLDWGRLGIGLGVELALKVVLLLVILTLTGRRFGPVSAGELTTIGVALLLVPFQAASEEILFRGYLTQSLGRFVSSRCAIAAIIALLFGLLHLNTYGPLTVPYFFVLSLLYSLVSLRDGRLELVIGAHTGMNLFAIGIGHAISTGTGGPAGHGAVHAAVFKDWRVVAALIIHSVLFYGLSRLLVRFFYDRPRVA